MTFRTPHSPLRKCVILSSFAQQEEPAAHLVAVFCPVFCMHSAALSRAFAFGTFCFGLRACAQWHIPCEPLPPCLPHLRCEFQVYLPERNHKICFFELPLFFTDVTGAKEEVLCKPVPVLLGNCFHFSDTAATYASFAFRRFGLPICFLISSPARNSSVVVRLQSLPPSNRQTCVPVTFDAAFSAARATTAISDWQGGLSQSSSTARRPWRTLILKHIHRACLLLSLVLEDYQMKSSFGKCSHDEQRGATAVPSFFPVIFLCGCDRAVSLKILVPDGLRWVSHAEVTALRRG